MFATFPFAASLTKRDDENLYEYWMSFSPLAPFFGVDWRFSALMSIEPHASRAVESAAMKVARSADSAAKDSAKLVRATQDAAVETTRSVAGAAVGAFDAPAAKAQPVEEAELVSAPAAKTPKAEAPKAEAPKPAADGRPANLLDKAPAKPSDLTLLKGVGPKVARELNDLGVWTFAQIAALTAAELEWIDLRLSGIKGRPVRDDWIGQAKALAKS